MKARETLMTGEDVGVLLRVMGAAALRAGIGLVGNRLGREAVAQAIARRPDGVAARTLARMFDLAEHPMPDRPAVQSLPLVAPAKVGNENVAPVESQTPSKFLDEKQLCGELGISPVTATKWRAQAEGPPFIRVGRLIRYARTAVEAWLTARTVGHTGTR